MVYMSTCCTQYVRVTLSLSCVVTCGHAGNYMQMMSVLQPIAFDVLECLSQLFDYYLYAVSLHAYCCTVIRAVPSLVHRISREAWVRAKVYLLLGPQVARDPLALGSSPW